MISASVSYIKNSTPQGSLTHTRTQIFVRVVVGENCRGFFGRLGSFRKKMILRKR